MRARQQAVDGEILRRLRTAALRPTVLRIGILQLLDDCTTRRLTAEAVYRALLARGLSPATAPSAGPLISSRRPGSP